MATHAEKPPIFVAPTIFRPDGTPKLARILVANRGEIACRVIRSCQQLALVSVAVYANEDANSLHVQMADEAICIGPADSRPYQNIEALVNLAKEAGIDGIHPGYGYLSENADFAAAVGAAGIEFIGPSPDSIAQLGDKRVAKEYLSRHSSVPLIPGYGGLDQDPAHLEAEADKIGYPVLIKASAGGGGKGLRVVREKADFRESFLRCVSEAERSFGSGHCLIEKYIETGKHIEIQVMGDGETFVSLLDRECSVQRRNQKIVEESPCSWMSDKMRQEMSSCAVEIARLLKYKSAGTVEFIVDTTQSKFYFLEVNTRIQVEHPVTEEVVGIDIVALQFYVASGGKLSSLPELKNIRQRGHAIEVRLCAENPFNDFLPCTGTIKLFKPAPNNIGSDVIHVLRYETGVQTGSEVSVHFDSMISKIIIWAPNRSAATHKMQYALKQTMCLGLITNQLFLLRIITNASFQSVGYTTRFIEQELENLLKPSHVSLVTRDMMMAAVLLNREIRRRQASSNLSAFSSIPSGFRNQSQAKNSKHQEFVVCELQPIGHSDAQECMVLRLSEDEYTVSTLKAEPPLTPAEKKVFYNQRGGALTRRYYHAMCSEPSRPFTACSIDCLEGFDWEKFTGPVAVLTNNRRWRFTVALITTDTFKREIVVHSSLTGFAVHYVIYNKLNWAGKFEQRAAGGGDGGDAQRKHVSPMPCHILQILAPDGTQVKTGDGLLVMESMKTEIRINAAAPGVVKMNVEKGAKISEGVVMCEVLAAEEPSSG